MRFTSIRSIILCATLLVAGTSMAGTGTCVADFAVSVTMDSFVGHCTTETFNANSGDAVLLLDVPVKNLQTGKKGRDEAMWKMFHEDTFPKIHASAQPAAMFALQPGVTNELPLQLTISGQTNEVKAALSNLKDEDGKRTFDAAFPVSLKSFGLKAPSMMFGAIKVADVVKVTAHVTIDGKTASRP